LGLQFNQPTPGGVGSGGGLDEDQGVEPDCQQLGSIDLGCRLAAYCGVRVGASQRCCQPVNADPLYGELEMAHGSPESDWKVFRELRVVALERLCARILAEADRLVSNTSATAHERFLQLYAHVNDQNDEVAAAFDDPRRSTMLIQLATMCRHDLLDPDELAKFSHDTRETAERLGKPR